MKKVVLVTGCSSGIGEEVCKQLIENEFIVYGISRRAFQLDGLNHICADVTNKESIDNAVKQIIEEEGKIDILVSNAGMGISSPVETTNIEDAKKLFDVNFFGMVNVIQAVCPSMRERKQGKIIMTSSLASKVGLPFQSFYGASKSALDSLGFALNLELHEFNIRCLNVLPGDTKTGFTASREKQEVETSGVYGEIMQRSVGKMEKDEQTGMSASKVAKVIVKYCKKNRMPLQRVVGAKNRILAFLIKLLPVKLANFVVRKMYA